MSDREFTLKELLRSHKATQAELPALDLGPIRQVFGDKEQLPEIDESPVGRVRLIRALHKKFGDGYASYPQAKGALDHYDNEVRHITTLKRLWSVRHGK